MLASVCQRDGKAFLQHIDAEHHVLTIEHKLVDKAWSRPDRGDESLSILFQHVGRCIFLFLHIGNLPG